MQRDISIHPTACAGFANPDAYERGRPAYPAATIDTVVALIDRIARPSSPARRIVDVGAGTGKFTRLLLAAIPNAEVIAVEPVEGMRIAFSKVLTAVQCGEMRRVTGASSPINLNECIR